MKLFLNTASPYARLIRVLLIETGLDGQTELVFVDPWISPEELLAANPAAKIPALSLDDGEHLVESSCISDYLITQSGTTKLSPLARSDPRRRLEILGLGRAAMDCSFGAVVQERFTKQSPLADRWLAAVPLLGLRLNELYAGSESINEPDLGDLTVGVAFEYIGFRLPQIEWTRSASALSNAVARIGLRKSLQATQPK